MTAMFDVKQGDTGPPLAVVLADGNGPVSLTGATVHIVVARRPGADPVINRVCVVDADQVTHTGQVTYAWQPGDTAVAKSFQVEFHVTFADGRLRTFPSDGYVLMRVHRDLG